VVLGVALPKRAESLRTDNRVATLEAAKVEFEATWRQWLAVKRGLTQTQAAELLMAMRRT
jgi:hypothetical protein